MAAEQNGPENFETDSVMDLERERNGQEGRSPRKRKPFVLSRRALAWWLLGFGVTMIWAFTLGVLVGRGTIFKNQAFQKIEKHLTPTAKPPKPPEVEVTDQPQSPDQKLTFYDNLSTSRKKPAQENLKTPSPKITPVKVETPEADPKPGGGASEVDLSKSGPGGSQDDKKKPEERKTTPAAASGGVIPVPAGQPGVRFTVQVAASDTMEQADKMARRLKQNGYDAYYYEIEVKGRRYVRVRVGRFATREEARAVMDELAAAGHSRMFIAKMIDE